MSQSREIVVLNRDTVALMVPSGARIILHEGTEVNITQALGDNFTVSVYGNLARIDAKDADALGKKVSDPLSELPDNATLEDKVWVQMQTVYDPEIPVNVVELGLIYRCVIEPVDDKSFRVNIDMTLTAPGCGMGPVIAEEVKQKVLKIPEVAEAQVDIVFDPPWTQDMMSDTAKLELGML